MGRRDETDRVSDMIQKSSRVDDSRMQRSDIHDDRWPSRPRAIPPDLTFEYWGSGIRHGGTALSSFDVVTANMAPFRLLMPSTRSRLRRSRQKQVGPRLSRGNFGRASDVSDVRHSDESSGARRRTPSSCPDDMVLIPEWDAPRPRDERSSTGRTDRVSGDLAHPSR